MASPIAFAARRPQGRSATGSTIRPIVAALFRFSMLIARSVPPPVWAFIAVFVLLPGLWPGVVALALYNVGVLGRLQTEVVENENPTPAATLRAIGASEAGAAAFATVPAVASRFVGLGLYRWEVVGETVIVGVVGAAGLGRRLDEQTSAFDYDGMTPRFSPFSWSPLLSISSQEPSGDGSRDYGEPCSTERRSARCGRSEEHSMSSGFTVDAALLLGGVLLVVGVVASGVAARARVPSLLLFLALGMAVADDGLGLIRFDDAALAQNIAVVALAIILFEGGLGTDPSSFREAGIPAALLATIGVVITAGVVGGAAMLLFGWDAATALLLGSVVASTDAAAVFAALRSEPLPRRTLRILQLESGLNDPVAVLLTVGLVEVWRADPSVADWALFLGRQLGFGAVVGFGVGVLGRWFISRPIGSAVSSLGVITLGIAAGSYGLASVVSGSGFLAVYLTGVLLASDERRARGVLFFHEGLAATAQGVLFLLLGILVFPARLADDLPLAAVTAGVLVFVARPIAVASVLVWSRTTLRRMVVISWAGLRGAVPVVLATIPFTAGHPDGELIFDVAFVVVVLSVALQAPTVGPLARRLGLVDETTTAGLAAELVPVDAHDADLVELSIHSESPLCGRMLRDVVPPGGARLVVIDRAAGSVIPTGSTEIAAGDVILVIVPRSGDLAELEAWHTGEWAS